MINPQIPNPQFCKEKGSVSYPIPHWFASNTFFYIYQYIWNYEMPCNYISKLSQKPNVVLKFEWEHFKLIFVSEKIMYLRRSAKNNLVRNSQITKNIWCANRKSANCHICGSSANLKNSSLQFIPTFIYFNSSLGLKHKDTTTFVFFPVKYVKTTDSKTMGFCRDVNLMSYFKGC